MEFRCLLGKLAKKNQATIGNEDENSPAVFIIYDSLYQTRCDHSVDELGHGRRIHTELLSQLAYRKPFFIRELIQYPPLFCRCTRFRKHAVQLF